MSSSLARLLSGRKRESPVWEYFEYCEESGKSKCVVMDEKTGNECGVFLAGKNSSNLISHLARFHKLAHAAFEEKDKCKEEERRGLKRKGPVDVAAPASKMQSLECLCLGMC